MAAQPSNQAAFLVTSTKKGSSQSSRSSTVQEISTMDSASSYSGSVVVQSAKTARLKSIPKSKGPVLSRMDWHLSLRAASWAISTNKASTSGIPGVAARFYGKHPSSAPVRSPFRPRGDRSARGRSRAGAAAPDPSRRTYPHGVSAVSWTECYAVLSEGISGGWLVDGMRVIGSYTAPGVTLASRCSLAFRAGELL